MESLDRILVVDADGHVNEGDVDISGRLPESWRSQGPVSVRDNQGYPRILLEGRIWGTAQMPNLRRRPSEIIRSEQLVLTCESEESGLDRVLEAAGPGTVLYASDYCHWDCNFPDSVKDICEARDLSLAQKERILGRNAVEFFGLGNLPEPNALRAARSGWTREAAVEGVLR